MFTSINPFIHSFIHSLAEEYHTSIFKVNKTVVDHFYSNQYHLLNTNFFFDFFFYFCIKLIFSSDVHFYIKTWVDLAIQIFLGGFLFTLSDFHISWCILCYLYSKFLVCKVCRWVALLDLYQWLYLTCLGPQISQNDRNYIPSLFSNIETFFFNKNKPKYRRAIISGKLTIK